MPQTKPDFSGLTLDMLESVDSQKPSFEGLTLDMLENPDENRPDFSNLPKIYDEFDTSSPEELYQVMKRNPGRSYSREQWNTYLEYMAEKDFSPTEVVKNFTSGIGPMVMEIAGGGLELAKMGVSAAGVLRPENTDPDKFKKVGDLAATGLEGALRAGYDLGIIGQMIQLNEALEDRVATPGPSSSYSSPYNFPVYKKRSYKDFPEEKKNQVIDLAMKLSSSLASRNEYAEGKGTILGDVIEGITVTDEESAIAAESAKEYLMAAVNPKAAEMLSIVNPLAPETLATRIGTRYGKPLQIGTTKSAVGLAAAGTQKAADAAGVVAEQVEKLKSSIGDNAPDVARVKGVSPGLVQNSLQTMADTLKAVERQVDKAGSDNFLLRISRDAEYAKSNPRMHRLARFWGHGIFNDVPALSPILRMATPVGNVVVDAGVTGTRGAIAGGLMTLPTGDEEMIGTSMAGAFGVGTLAGAGKQAFWKNKTLIDNEANRFLNQMGPEARDILQRRIDSGELGMGDIARMSAFETWAKRFTSGITGDTDVDFIYWDGNNIEAVESYLTEQGVDQALKLDEVQAVYENQFENKDADRIVSPTRGMQILNTRQAGSKPVVVVNLEQMTGSTLIHESIHALKRLDIYKGAFDDIEGILFDKPGRGDDDATNGLVSDADLERFYREYLDRFIQSANTPEQVESAKRMVRDIVKMDQRRADNATPGTPQADVAYWQRTRMKEEVVADVFESFMMSKDPLYVTKAGLETNSQRLARPFSRVIKTMTSWMGATTAPGALSVQNYRKDGKRIAYDSPALEASINNLINFQNRITEKNGKLTRAEVGEGETGESFRRNQIRKNTALAKSLEASILVKHDENGNAIYDSDGFIVFEESQKAIRDKENARANFFRDTISKQVLNDDEQLPGKQPVRLDTETGEITGDYLHRETLQALRNAPRYLMPPRLLKHLETVNEAAKTGNVIEMDYNPRLYVRNGRSTQKAQYSSALGSTIRHVVPFSMRITKAGNLTFNALDITHLTEKYNRVMRDPRRSKNITQMWGGDRAAFQKDMLQYLENATNPPEQYDGGLARGLDDNPAAARKKANVLSAFMGFKKKDIDWRNNTSRQDSLLRDMNPERQDNVIRTRRLDAVNDVRSTDMPRMPMSQSAYRDIQRNLEPGDIGGFNVRNEDGAPYADLIVSGEKTIETRPGKSLDTLIGKRMKVIRTTGVGSEARVVGEVTVGPRKFYATKQEFDADLDKHFVTDDSRFAFPETGKYGYEMIDPVKYQKPYPLTVNKGVVSTRNVPGPRYEPGQSLEDRVRKMDVGDKTKKQVGLNIADYPANPNADSVALPARLGLVNRNIAGVPNSYAEVLNIVEEQLGRIEALRVRDPEFAKRSAGFYEDMARVGLNVAEFLRPVNRSQYDAADLIIRLIALGSPRSSVSSNASKSVRSAMAPVSGTAGYKIGMGTAQLGAKRTSGDWKEGKHFDVLSKNAIGADDKVRNFYLNAMADLIDMAAAQGKKNDVTMLQKRVAKTLGIHDKGLFTPSLAKQVQTFLDGLATVDMWDMAAKGYAHPAWVIPRGRGKGDKAFNWSVPKQRVKQTISDPLWKKALKEAEIMVPGDKGKMTKRSATSLMELDYQYARAFYIDGRRDWDPISWEARKAEGFDPDTEWSYYKKTDDGGLSPGGSGPVYDAQQMIDGLIADEMNRQGLAEFYGKTKLKARNAQEILWAVEKLDNPILANRELVLFGDRLNDFTDALKTMFGGGDWQSTLTEKAGRAIELVNDTYNRVELQAIPIEVTSQGASAEAASIQDLQAQIGVEEMTQVVADGLADKLQSAIDTVGANVMIVEVKTGQGGYKEGESANTSPNIAIGLRGDPNQTRAIMEALSLGWDQDGGNLIRKPTLEELSSGRTLNTAIKFSTGDLNAAQKKSFYEDLAALKDSNGETFLTGFTETPDGMFIGDQFYDGDMELAVDQNYDVIKELTQKHNVPSWSAESVVIDVFNRPGDQAARDEILSGYDDLSKSIYDIAVSSVASGKQKFGEQGASQVNQRVDVVGRAKQIASETKSAPTKTARDKLNVRLAEPIDIMVLDELITSKQAKEIKAELKQMVESIPIVAPKKKPKKVLKKKAARTRKKS